MESVLNKLESVAEDPEKREELKKDLNRIRKEAAVDEDLDLPEFGVVGGEAQLLREQAARQKLEVRRIFLKILMIWANFSEIWSILMI